MADGGTAPSIGIASETALSDFILSTAGDALIISGNKTSLELDKANSVLYFFYQEYTNQGDIRIL